MDNLKIRKKGLYTIDEKYESKNLFSKDKNYNFLIVTKIIIIFIFLIIFFIFNDKMNILESHLVLSKKSVIANEISINFINNLKSILKDDELIENEMMKKHTTFRTGGTARFWLNLKLINKLLK